jgi:hypothetical protein
VQSRVPVLRRGAFSVTRRPLRFPNADGCCELSDLQRRLLGARVVLVTKPPLHLRVAADLRNKIVAQHLGRSWFRGRTEQRREDGTKRFLDHRIADGQGFIGATSPLIGVILCDQHTECDDGALTPLREDLIGCEARQDLQRRLSRQPPTATPACLSASS